MLGIPEAACLSLFLFFSGELREKTMSKFGENEWGRFGSGLNMW